MQNWNAWGKAWSKAWGVSWGAAEDPITGGGGSGVSRLAGYFSRPAESTYFPPFFADLLPVERQEVKEIAEAVPQEAIEALVEEKDPLPSENRLGRLVKESAPKSKGPDLAKLAKHFETIRRLEMWRREEEDIAILLLSM